MLSEQFWYTAFIKHVQDTILPVVLYDITNIGNRWDRITIFHTGCIYHSHYHKTSIISFSHLSSGDHYVKYVVNAAYERMLNISMAKIEFSPEELIAPRKNVHPSLDIFIYSYRVFSRKTLPSRDYITLSDQFCAENEEVRGKCGYDNPAMTSSGLLTPFRKHLIYSNVWSPWLNEDRVPIPSRCRPQY